MKVNLSEGGLEIRIDKNHRIWQVFAAKAEYARLFHEGKTARVPPYWGLVEQLQGEPIPEYTHEDAAQDSSAYENDTADYAVAVVATADEPSELELRTSRSVNSIAHSICWYVAGRAQKDTNAAIGKLNRKLNEERRAQRRKINSSPDREAAKRDAKRALSALERTLQWAANYNAAIVNATTEGRLRIVFEDFYGDGRGFTYNASPLSLPTPKFLRHYKMSEAKLPEEKPCQDPIAGFNVFTHNRLAENIQN